ncbi:MAG TPA: phage tail length tape measure family protein [Azospirillum sp.]|nr:phage tail length tape measure family protein [Azospirillum sp.]
MTKVAEHVVLKLTAEAEDFVVELRKATGEVSKLGDTGREAGQQLSQALGRLDTLADEAKQSLGAAAGAADRAGAAFGGAASANDNLATKTRFSTQQIQALSYTASDVAASLSSGASPFTVLMQQGGQLLQAFPGITGRILGIGAAAAVIAAPIGIVAARMASIGAEGRELASILKAMGNEAGITAGQLRDMANVAIHAGASRSEAYQSTLELVRNPDLRDPELFRSILELAPDVAAVLGYTIPAAAAKMGDALGKGGEGVKRLDAELNFLSVEQERQVRMLADHGNKAGALNVAIEALRQRYGGAAQTMRSEWGAALHDAGVAWDAYVDRLARSDIAKLVAGKVSDAAKALRAGIESDRASLLRAEIERIDREYGRLPEKTSGVPAMHEALVKRRIELQRELNDLTKQDNAPPANGSGGVVTQTDNLKDLSNELEKVMAECEFSDEFLTCPEVVSAFEEAIK